LTLSVSLVGARNALLFVSTASALSWIAMMDNDPEGRGDKDETTRPSSRERFELPSISSFSQDLPCTQSLFSLFVIS
jgi:hypothetical protein